ncbi:MAG: hypothetical protein P8Y29_07540 [Gemmatimonadota bacterium]
MLRRKCSKMGNRLHDLLWAYFSALNDPDLEPERSLMLQYASMREELIALVNQLSLHGVDRPGLPHFKDLPASYQELQDRALLLKDIARKDLHWCWLVRRRVNRASS